MPRKPADSPSTPPEQFFVKELAGETAPSFSAMKRLYGLASTLCGLRPWQHLDESELILVRDSASGELCYCSVMGALGEVFSMHAYIGDAGLRAFRRVEAQQIGDPGEFLANARCVYVEFVGRAELERQDRELLAVLGHPRGRGLASPLFRSMRSGFHPWFVTQQEAVMLAECVQAVIVICSALLNGTNARYWDQAETYPLVSRVEGAEPRFRIDRVKPVLPPEPTVAPVRLDENELRLLRNRDYPVRGVMELDYFFMGGMVGKKNERKSSASLALAVDAETGLVLAPEVTDSTVLAGEALAGVFLKAIGVSRSLPKEVHVRTQPIKDCLTPFMQSFGVKVRVEGRLRAADEARAGLFRFFGEGAGKQ